MMYVVLVIVAVGALGLAGFAVQVALASAEASAAQAGATMEVGAALMQAQCLIPLAAVLGLAAGIGIGYWLRRRQEAIEQARLAALAAQLRAAEQPRRSNGQWRQGRQPAYPMMPMMQYPALPPAYYYPQAQQQRPAEPTIIELDDAADDADYLSNWGFR